MKYNLSPEQPQIVEKFTQQLMEGAEEAGGQVGGSEIQTLPSGWRFRVPQFKSNKNKNSFVPYAVNLRNLHMYIVSLWYLCCFSLNSLLQAMFPIWDNKVGY